MKQIPSYSISDDALALLRPSSGHHTYDPVPLSLFATRYQAFSPDTIWSLRREKMVCICID